MFEQQRIEESDLVTLLAQDRSQPIYQPVDGWIIEYPEFAKLADEQMHTFWPWDEPEVQNDLKDLRTKLIKPELHGVTTTLQLFTHYEIHAGVDYWTQRIMPLFKRPEFERMTSLFGAVELNSHAPFYNEVNQVLNLDTPEFYNGWKRSPVLVERMKFIGRAIKSEDDLISLGSFSFIEGAVLYSSFAFLKHFQAQQCGKNLLLNTCRGVNLSVGDENTHAIGGAMLFQTVKSERELTAEQDRMLELYMKQIGYDVFLHEAGIIEMIYAEGDIPNLPKDTLLDFVKHRINLCLSNLGYSHIFDEDQLDNFIATWFYTNINSLQFHDFFTGNGSEYHMKWKRERFGVVWRKNKVELLAAETV